MTGSEILRGCCAGLLLAVTTAVVAQPGPALVVPVASQASIAPRTWSSLDTAIAFYRQLAEREDWPMLTRSPVLHPGERHPILTEVRRRLTVLGDIGSAEAVQDPSLFDDSLEQGLLRFQRRHGLDPDGIWGPRSRAALSVSPQQRYRQLLLNRQRRDALLQKLGQDERYVQINIPGFEMHYFEQGHEVLQMRAIVGRYKNKTPLVTSRIETLELNPDWNVPAGIAWKELVPELQSAPDALAKKGIELVRGFGHAMRTLPIALLDYDSLYRGPQPQQRFWQPPGPDNPLGQMKFTFPNPYQVYMHGTPAVSLFDKPSRAFSHGCIRIEHPGQLAQLLFGDAGRTSQGTWLFDDIVASGENRILKLPQPVPFFTTYWTAWLDADGELQFRDDVYRRDAKDMAALSLPRYTAVTP